MTRKTGIQSESEIRSWSAMTAGQGIRTGTKGGTGMKLNISTSKKALTTARVVATEVPRWSVRRGSRRRTRPAPRCRRTPRTSEGEVEIPDVHRSASPGQKRRRRCRAPAPPRTSRRKAPAEERGSSGTQITIAAQKRGATAFATGSIAISPSAVIWSVARISPSSAAIELPARPMNSSAVSTGASSRYRPSPQR